MNDILKRIKQTVVDPALQDIKTSTVGYVTAVDYEKQTADVLLIERDGTRRRRNGLAFPKVGAGLLPQSLKPGDRVEVGYRNSQYHSTYISQLYRSGGEELSASYGQELPFSTDLF